MRNILQTRFSTSYCFPFIIGILTFFLDASLFRLQKKLTEGSTMETGERGANKVRTIKPRRQES